MRLTLPTVFILLTVMFDAMGIGLVMPVMPDLLQQIRGDGLADAAIWGGVLTTAFAVMQFLCGPLLGNLSDRFGRRPVLLVSLGVMSLSYLAMAVAGSLWLLLAARILSGAASATHATAAAFMADTLPTGQRGRGFGLVSAAFGAGFVLGPVLGGILGDMGTRAPFHAAALLAGANFVLGMIVLPETVTAANRRPLDPARANPLGALARIRALPGMGRLIAVFFLYQVSFNVYPIIWAFFTTASFGWDASMIGLSLAAFGISMALVQGGLIGMVIARLGERRTVFLGLGFGMVSFLAMVLVRDGALALALLPVCALAAMGAPALQAIMSRDAAADAQGESQGIITSTSALAMIVSPVVMTNVFAAFTAPGAAIILPGAPFVASMCLLAVAGALFLSHPRDTRARIDA